jgi:Domain of unknown function (DUF4780)
MMARNSIDGEKRERDTDEAKASYSSATMQLDFFVANTDYPKSPLGEEDQKVLETHLLTEMRKLEKGEGPVFAYRAIYKGAIHFACIGQRTVDFLRESVESFKGEKALKLMSREEMPRDPRYHVRLVKSDVTFQEVCRDVAIQNGWVNTEEWKLVKRRKDGEDTLFTFYTNESESEKIEARKGKIFYLFGIIILNLANRKEIEGLGETEAMSAQAGGRNSGKKSHRPGKTPGRTCCKSER